MDHITSQLPMPSFSGLQQSKRHCSKFVASNVEKITTQKSLSLFTNDRCAEGTFYFWCTKPKPSERPLFWDGPDRTDTDPEWQRAGPPPPRMAEDSRRWIPALSGRGTQRPAVESPEFVGFQDNRCEVRRSSFSQIRYSDRSFSTILVISWSCLGRFFFISFRFIPLPPFGWE